MTTTATRPAPGDFTGAPATPWEMPGNLTPNEEAVYRRAYSRSTVAAARKNPTAVQHGAAGAPAPDTDAGRALRAQLAGTTADAIADRHPAAHRAGMAAVRKWIRDTADVDTDARLAAIGAAPARTPRRKVTPLEPVTDVDVTTVAAVSAPADALERAVSGRVAAGTATPIVCDPTPEVLAHDIGAAYAREYGTPDGDTYPAARAARKVARRELAAAMRAADIDPHGDAWTACLTAAGLTPLTTA